MRVTLLIVFSTLLLLLANYAPAQVSNSSASQTSGAPPTIPAPAPPMPAAPTTGSMPGVTNTPRTGPAARENYDPLLDPPPLPHAQVTLMGAMVTNVNEIQNRLTIQPFGGKQRLHLDFDARTHIFRDGQAASERELQAGQRVYLDTMLNAGHVFAKSIWIQTGAGSGNGRGQIVRYDDRSKALTIRDEVSAQSIKFQLGSGTIIRNGNATGSVADLKPGSLVAITFGSGKGRSGVVQELTLLAVPGSTFTFLGRITFVDVSRKMIAVANQNDGKSYDIYFESIPVTVLQRLHEGSQASISALFEGDRYVAQKIDLLENLPGTKDDSPR